MKATIKFEIDATPFNGITNPKDALHEALCKAIHEGDADALQWLEDNVLDLA